MINWTSYSLVLKQRHPKYWGGGGVQAPVPTLMNVIIGLLWGFVEREDKVIGIMVKFLFEINSHKYWKVLSTYK